MISTIYRTKYRNVQHETLVVEFESLLLAVNLCIVSTDHKHTEQSPRSRVS
jgi:hypothetical protein